MNICLISCTRQQKRENTSMKEAENEWKKVKNELRMSWMEAKTCR